MSKLLQAALAAAVLIVALTVAFVGWAYVDGENEDRLDRRVEAEREREREEAERRCDRRNASWLGDVLLDC